MIFPSQPLIAMLSSALLSAESLTSTKLIFLACLLCYFSSIDIRDVKRAEIPPTGNNKNPCVCVEVQEELVVNSSSLAQTRENASDALQEGPDERGIGGKPKALRCTWAPELEGARGVRVLDTYDRWSSDKKSWWPLDPICHISTLFISSTPSTANPFAALSPCC